LKVDANHVERWSAGGETSLDNLVLLCSKHHKLVHEGGFTIQRDYQNRWFFQRPDGRAVPSCGYHTKDITDDDIGRVTDSLLNRKNPARSRYLNDGLTLESRRWARMFQKICCLPKPDSQYLEQCR